MNTQEKKNRRRGSKTMFLQMMKILRKTRKVVNRVRKRTKMRLRKVKLHFLHKNRRFLKYLRLNAKAS